MFQNSVRHCVAIVFAAALINCSSSDNSSASGSGGESDHGGSVSSGGMIGRAGADASGGAPFNGGSGGAPSGGALALGGSKATGGGAATGGAVSAGGAGTGGLAAGGTAAIGGAGAGGAATGGAGAGGAATGGAGVGGAGTGGAGTGGAATGPCDLYALGNTPCVAAHSTVRALYGAYNGNLYQIRRASDQTTRDIGVLTTGGLANAPMQDAFCAGTTCTVSIIYDQSGKANHLTKAPAGGAKRTPDNEANATALKLTVAGHAVYGVHIPAGVGYRIDRTSGTAKGDSPESEYMVTSGNYFNNGCCFDYGNAETNDLDNGAGHMEAVYFGNATFQGKGAGRGPWVMADLENGLFAGIDFGPTASNTPLTSTYVTAMVIGRTGSFALKGGDSQAGKLTTMYDGPRPTMRGYNPMKKEGAIILGIGGDNSNGAQGNFFEGCMTTGASSSATDDAVQANIVAAGYGR